MSKTLVIVGGGITGMAAAYLAARNGRKVTILEGAPNVGGLLNTFEIGGNRLEYFYHHFFTHDAEIKWLLNELGLGEEVHYKKTTMGVFRDGKIYDFNSPLDLFFFKPISWLGKFRFGLTTLYLTKLAQWQNFEHVPAYSWFYKWAGKSATNALWGPMLKVKFGPYFDQVPLSWMIGRLRQRMNSRKQGDERLGYLKGSLQVLSDTLQAKLLDMGVDIRTSEPVVSIEQKGEFVSSVRTEKAIFESDDFLFTLPTIHLKNIEGIHSELAEQLGRISYFGVYCMVLSLRERLSDVYWLNVADPGYSFGGVIEHTNLIDAEEYSGQHLVYLSRYFAQSEEIAVLGEDEVKRQMLQDLKHIYPDLADEKIIETKLFRSNTAAMVNDLNFSMKVPPCQTLVPNVYLCNMAHIYPDERSVNNSIRIAAEAIRTMGMHVDFVPANLSLSGQIGFQRP
ncbi:MAG: NAD(P)/FAD-dependent oxidoreductase [Flavobacteriales bacterium]|nr:NAD(P)/FAD-dependent oxidoreductase [Flavobacteriales bacterium]